MKTVLVINMGLKSIRCIIFDENGMKLGSDAIPINTAIDEKKVEQDPAEWRDKAFVVVRNALKQSRISHIDYITVTTSASCLVCVDNDGNPLGRAFMISDKRSETEAEYIAKLPEFETVRIQTGLDMSASLMLPKILWVKKHSSETYNRSAYFLTPNDYLISLLTGSYVTDELNATKYHYSCDDKKYPTDLLRSAGIDQAKLPDVRPVGTTIGQIKSDIADRMGINHDAQVVISSYDAICSFVGSGVTKEGEASDVSGTVTVFRMLATRPVKTEVKSRNRAVYALPFISDDKLIIGGSNNMGGGLIEWVKQCYYRNENYPYEVMEKDAAESEPGARGLIFLPYLLGERAPIWNDHARGVFFGLERIHTRKDMTRAVFESAGFIDRDMMEAIHQNGEIKVDCVRFSGGLARVNLIAQIKADVLGKEILVLQEFETTSTGAAMIVLLSCGIYDSLEAIASRFIRIRMVIHPNPENHRIYDYMYEIYKDTYNTLVPLFEKRMEIMEKIHNTHEVQIENL